MIRAFLRLARLLAYILAIVGYCGIVYVAAHFSGAATIAAIVIFLLVFGRLFNSPA
jgi:hypothetical protein